MNKFAKDWEDWINLNLSLGNCKQIMFKKSLDAGYDFNLIKEKLGIDYIISDNSSNTTYIDKIALKNAIKLNSNNLEIYKIDNFLTKEECQEIINIINSENLVRSSTINVNDKDGNSQINNFRTSQTCYFNSNDKHLTIDELETRICKTIGINNRFSETMQGQKYCVGEEFKLHTDYFESQLLEKKHINGQRTWTFMIYLNDVEEGGYTSFPYTYISIKPKTGTAIIWNNLNKDKSTNVYSSHHGMPIIKGEKYILTKWFKEREINLSVKNEICSHHFLPIFHEVGFEKMHLKLQSIENIKNWMDSNSNNFITENLNRHTDSANKDLISKLLDVNKSPIEFQIELINDFKKLLTEWINYKSELEHVVTYGIREYNKGSILKNHYDVINSHVISAIIHLDDDTETPWELYIEDHNYKPYNISMKYGDILFYESTTCLHGRPKMFEGVSHKNMYVHFKPLKWNECTNLIND